MTGLILRKVLLDKTLCIPMQQVWSVYYRKRYCQWWNEDYPYILKLWLFHPTTEIYPHGFQRLHHFTRHHYLLKTEEDCQSILKQIQHENER